MEPWICHGQLPQAVQVLQDTKPNQRKSLPHKLVTHLGVQQTAPFRQEVVTQPCWCSFQSHPANQQHEHQHVRTGSREIHNLWKRKDAHALFHVAATNTCLEANICHWQSLWRLYNQWNGKSNCGVDGNKIPFIHGSYALFSILFLSA